jgi:hypothetical protein
MNKKFKNFKAGKAIKLRQFGTNKLIKGGPKDAKKPATAEKNLTYAEKTSAGFLNNHMSNKSLFEKLFEEVMNDPASPMGGDMGPEDTLELGNDMGGMGGDMDGDEITISIPRDVAERLHDILMAAMGGGDVDVEIEDEDLGDEDDFDMDDMDSEGEMSEDEDEELFAFEGIDIKEMNPEPAVRAHTSKGNMKVRARLQPGGGRASAVGATDKVGNDGDLGHAGVSGGLKKGKPGQDMKAPGTKTSKPGDLFA